MAKNTPQRALRKVAQDLARVQGLVADSMLRLDGAVATLQQTHGSAVATELKAAERLTHRETEICRLLIQGARVKSVAQRLQLSPHTIRSHLKTIFRKLEVHSQEQLIDRFARVHSTVHERPLADDCDCEIYRTLLEAAPWSAGGSLLIDAEGKILALTPAAAGRLGGRDESQLVGAMVYDFFPERLARIRRRRAELVVTRGHWHRFFEPDEGDGVPVLVCPILGTERRVEKLAVFFGTADQNWSQGVPKLSPR